jgi:hypothetical protein
VTRYRTLPPIGYLTVQTHGLRNSPAPWAEQWALLPRCLPSPGRGSGAEATKRSSTAGVIGVRFCCRKTNALSLLALLITATAAPIVPMTMIGRMRIRPGRLMTADVTPLDSAPA